MSRQTMQESLSAVMDNQADELELRRVLAASEDPEIRATLARYQLARAAMHKELIEPRLDLASAVSAAIADEPVVVKKAGLMRSVGRWAVAASVTVAVLAGVRLYNENDIAGTQIAQSSVAPLSVPSTNNLAVLAAFNTSEDAAPQAKPESAEEQAQWHEQRLPTYLRQHAQQAAGSNEGALPFARSASLEER